MVLYRAVAVHVPHRLHKLLLAVVELCLQRVQLLAHVAYACVQLAYVAANGVDALALVGNLRVDYHQVLQPLLHVALVVAQLLLLRFYLFLYLRALVAQPGYRCGLLLGGAFLCGACCLCLLSGRALLSLCATWGNGQGQRQQQNTYIIHNLQFIIHNHSIRPISHLLPYPSQTSCIPTLHLILFANLKSRSSGVPEYRSADICSGMRECRSTGVQTFASECGSAVVRY